MKHIVLLERCHAYFRGVQERTPDGLKSIDKDLLAKEINDYLNHVQTHAEGCWSWGPEHYMCAYERIKELESKNA
jgi:hypothetical protein